MSGDSPGRGHPGWGSSPTKAQASRPTMGENSQTSTRDANPKVSSKLQNGQNVSNVVMKKKDEEMRVIAARKEESPKPSQQGAQVRQSAGHAAGVQLPPPAQRQRRTSLERQTLQENLQQQRVVSSKTCPGRTRSHATGKPAEVKSVAKTQNVSKPAAFPNPARCEPGPATTSAAGEGAMRAATSTAAGGGAMRAGDGKPKQSAERLPRPGQPQKETARAPELQMAEEIPALVRRMGELKHHKQMLQMQIDCVYSLKTAHPESNTMYDSKLHSLSIELAVVVKEMDCVLERMGPLAESYRNQERFSQQKCDPRSRAPAAPSGSIPPDEPQRAPKILKPASFSFQKGNTQEQPQTPTPVPVQHHGAVVPQVPAGTVQQQDSGHVSISQDDAVTEERSIVVPETGDIEQHVDVSEGSGDNVQSVWEVPPSVGDMEGDGAQEVIRDSVSDFPPLTSSTADETGPSRADSPPNTESEPRQEPPRNAWSRGAPSFTSGAHYSGQAFKRRNVVRFKHRGAKEDLPDRRFVVRELLCRQMGFEAADILAVINLPDRQGYDVSFKLMSSLDRFWANFTRFRDTEGWSKFIFIPISKPDTAVVNIIFWNESVPSQDILVWLRRHCDLMSDLTKNRDADGIWTGGWKVLVKLRQLNNITLHLPNSFFIGREKGVCFYPGQPRKCFKCGKIGHVASVCTVVKCNLCGEVGHLSATCKNIRCNLCGQIGHSHKDCPNAWHNLSRDLSDDDLVQEEEALMSGEILTRQEVPQVSGDIVPEPQSESAQGSMEVVPQVQPQASSSVITSEYVDAKSNKRRKKDKISRKPEEHAGPKPKKKVSQGTEVMVLSNRYEVLSESDGEYERELEKINDECEADSGDPPTKRKPPHVDTAIESDMETGGRQEDSDSDI